MTINVLVRHGRYTNEVFTSAPLTEKAKFEEIVAALKAKNFAVEVNEFELLGLIALTVTKLRSDAASQYATDIIIRAGRRAGFSFLSTTHK